MPFTRTWKISSLTRPSLAELERERGEKHYHHGKVGSGKKCGVSHGYTATYLPRRGTFHSTRNDRSHHSGFGITQRYQRYFFSPLAKSPRTMISPLHPVTTSWAVDEYRNLCSIEISYRTMTTDKCWQKQDKIPLSIFRYDNFVDTVFFSRIEFYCSDMSEPGCVMHIAWYRYISITISVYRTFASTICDLSSNLCLAE